MYKSVLFLLFTLSSFFAAAANKIYYDKAWQVTNKRNAEWYRLYTAQGNMYKIEDHYIDGPIFKTGYQTTLESASCVYRIGPYVFYDKAGHKQREGLYSKGGLRFGTWKYYFDGTDVLEKEFHYAISDTGEYRDTVLVYDRATSKLKKKTVFIGAKEQSWEYTDTGIPKAYEKEIKASAEPKLIFSYVEQMPSIGFDFKAYLGKSIKYPLVARSSNIEGRVIIKFRIDEDGAISNPKIAKGIGGGCDEEALRVITEMPYWQPGKQNGNPVFVYFTQPISFQLK